MFPVPDHLPRTRGDTADSGGNTSSTRPQAEEAQVEVDLVLDLLEPILREKELRSETIRDVREKLETAARRNKVSTSPATEHTVGLIVQDVTHQLLKANYPSISSNIRAGSQIKADFASIESRLSDLEAEIDPDNAEVHLHPTYLETERV